MVGLRCWLIFKKIQSELGNGCLHTIVKGCGLLSSLCLTPSHLHDDPYSSLMGELRLSGGLAKDVPSGSEFGRADFFWNLIPNCLAKQDFNRALT